ncbi:flagellar motor switch protein FliN [Intrasporangium sp. YIM S08009]|uniref:flagellar motor switch protein FliN n=1 Tax=Intrasporangium zincisolvens TaxID=3080018 RepID=UPI002B05524B|nr:flagellar motor switch protein FliN [Intrasporangium sp. YIM S08009]
MSTATLASAAEHLVASLPVPGLRVLGQVGPDAVAGPADAAVVAASLVGPHPADLVLVALDTRFVAEAGGGPAASATVVLRPAFERAAAALGDGVLSELVDGDPSGLLSDPEGTAFFEISDGAAPFGWLGVRGGRGAGASGAPLPSAASSVVGAVAGSVAGATGAFDGRLRRIQDVEMALTVEIGRTRMSVRDALSLEPGAVVELDRSAGAPVDVLLNGRRIALGEVVVVDQDYAVRISRILDTAEGRP